MWLVYSRGIIRGIFNAPTVDLDKLLYYLNKNLQTTIDKLAPVIIVNPKSQKHPWINAEVQFLINKRNATEKRYFRTKNKALLTELIHLNRQVEYHTDTARNSFIYDRLDEAITNGQDFWRELHHLGLLPTPKSDLHGFSPDELNEYFSQVCFTESENLLELSDILMSASDEGFKFREVSISSQIF